MYFWKEVKFIDEKISQKLKIVKRYLTIFIFFEIFLYCPITGKTLYFCEEIYFWYRRTTPPAPTAQPYFLVINKP